MVKRYAEAIDRILDVVDVRRTLSMEELEEYVQFENPVYMEGTGYIEPIIRAIKEKRTIGIVYEAFGKSKEEVQSAKCKVQNDKIQDTGCRMQDAKSEIVNLKSEIRILHPYLLKEYRNRWYVVGLDEEKNEIRTFGLDRIKSISPSPPGEGNEGRQPIAYRKVDFDPKTYFRHTIGIIAPQSKPPEIRIEFTKRQAQYLITQPIHPSQKVLKETKEKVVFGFEVHPTYEFISMILGYREEVSILAPIWLKKKIKELLKKIMKQYD